MNITGKTMVFKSDYGYSTSVSHKNQNGEYERMYVSLQLPKGVELGNKAQIEITKGFLSTYKSKEEMKLKIVVMEFTSNNESEDDLPF